MRMKKISINKNELFWIFFCISFTISMMISAFIMGLLSETNKISSPFLWFCVSIIGLMLISYSFFPSLYIKNKKIIYINNQSFEYKDYKKPINDFKIAVNFIEKVYCRPTELGGQRFVIILKDQSRREIKLVSKKMARRIAKSINQSVEYSKLEKKQKIKRNFWKDFKNFIKDEKKIIIYIIIGLLITICSFIIENKYDNKLISIILSVLCIVLGGLQLNEMYLKEKYDKLSDKLIIGSIFFFVFCVIQFGVICLVELVLLKNIMSIKYLFYVFYTIPSFVIVILILVLLLMSLSYA